MSEWFIVIAIILFALVGALMLGERLARRYSIEIRRRIQPYAGAPPKDANDPFDDDGRAAG